MNVKAARITRVDLLVERTIAGGETITVFGILVANSTDNPAEVDILDIAGDKEITVTVPPKDSELIPFEFIADQGLKICSLASDEVFVTVFHSQGGS